jgi:hypothetical protein
MVTTASARSVNAARRSRTAGISFDFAATATCPRTAPMPCANAATRCGAFPSLCRAPRTVLPSTATTNRPVTWADRVHNQAPRTLSSLSASTATNARRNVDSSAAPRAAPSVARASPPASAAHCPIAANDRDPATTAAIPTANRPTSECRRPRFLRGSEIWASRSSRYWLPAAAMHDDVIGGWGPRASTASVRTSIEPLEPYPPPTDTPSHHRPRESAGHSPTLRPCRIPDRTPDAESMSPPPAATAPSSTKQATTPSPPPTPSPTTSTPPSTPSTARTK